jgi:signal transduction histidine kinase
MYFLCLIIITSLQAQEFDFSRHDFSERSIVRFDGEWRYYPNRLHPGQVSDSVAILVNVPSYLDPSQKSPYALYQITYKVDGLRLPGIWVSNINGAFAIYQNGKLLAEVGKVGDSPETSRPARKSLVLPLDYERGRVDTLSIVFSNFKHVRAGIDDSVLLGEFATLSSRREFYRAFDWFLAGFLTVGSFFFLGLFINGKGQKMALFFMLFCLSYAYRVVGWDSYALHDVLDIPYFLSIRLEYATLYLCGLTFTLYVRYLFPEETPKRLAYAFAVISLLWTSSVLLPVNLFTRLNYTYLFILLIGIVLISFIYLKAMLNKRLGANYSVYATLFILLIFLLKVLDYLKVIEEPVALTMFAQAAFFSFQSLALTTHFAQRWKRDTEKAEKAIQELKAAQKQLIESEKMASIGVLTSGLAHEINNPLNIIGGVVEPIRSNLKELQEQADGTSENTKALFAEVHTLLDGVSDGARRASAIINNLLGIAPKSARDYSRTFDLSDLVKNCIFLYEKSHKKVQFQVSLPDHLEIEGNPDEINQVLLNVVKNALDALEEAKDPILSIGYEKMSKSSFQIIIKDNGSGIPEEVLPDLFNPFVTTKEPGKGTGLGLYISKSIMLKHGGEVEIENHATGGVSCRLIFKPKS